MNIAFVMPDFRGGGAEMVFIKLANYFALDHNVFMLVGDIGGPNSSELSNKIRIFKLRSRHGVGAFIELAGLSYKLRFDFVIGTLGMAYGVALAKFFIKNNCVVVSRIGNTVSAEIERQRMPLKRLLLKHYQKILCKADYIVAQSDYMANDLKKYIKKELWCSKIRRIYNPVSFIRMDNNKKDRESFCFAHERVFRFVAVGRIEPQKDYKSMITAFSKVCSTSNCELHIYGEGTLTEEMNKYCAQLNIGNFVFFHGYVANVRDKLANYDAMVLTSLYEGFSNVVLEALSSCLPIVATDSPGGNKEVIIDGHNGYLVKVGDVEGIASAMLRVIQTRPKFTFDTAPFEIDNIGKQYLDIYYEAQKKSSL